MAYTKEFKKGFEIKKIKEIIVLNDFEKEMQNSPDGKIEPLEQEKIDIALLKERAKLNMDPVSLDEYEEKESVRLGGKKAQKEAYVEAAAPIAKAIKRNAAAIGNLVTSKIRKVAEKFGVVDKKQEVTKTKSADLEM